MLLIEKKEKYVKVWVKKIIDIYLYVNNECKLNWLYGKMKNKLGM